MKWPSTGEGAAVVNIRWLDTVPGVFVALLSDNTLQLWSVVWVCVQLMHTLVHTGTSYRMMPLQCLMQPCLTPLSLS